MNTPLFQYNNHVYQRTDWFGDYVKPVHVGVYERAYKGMGAAGEPNFCLWDGTEWYCPFDTPAEALESGKSPWLASDYQHLPWRGLTRLAA